MEQGKVKFIRVNGRVVPIKAKSGESQKKKKNPRNKNRVFSKKSQNRMKSVENSFRAGGYGGLVVSAIGRGKARIVSGILGAAMVGTAVGIKHLRKSKKSSSSV